MNEKHDVIIQTVKGILEVRRQQPNRLDHARTLVVKSGVRRLKELGLSNREIFEALDGAWSEVAIKQMTAGARAKDPEARRSFGQVLNEITTSDYTGADLERLRPILRSRIDHNLAMEFLENVAQSKMDPVETLLLYKRMNDKGISPEIAVKINSMTEALSSCGYTMGTLEKFKEASPDYDPGQLLEAISVQRGIDKMKITEQKQAHRLRENDRELGLRTAEIVKVEARRKTLEAPLKKLDSLYSEGWNDDLLDMTFKATTKLGKPKDVLEAIYLSGSISSMKEEVLNLQRELSDEESKLKNEKSGKCPLCNTISDG